MKKLFLSLTLSFSAAMIFAQTPNAFNYQAVARNSSGAAIATTAIAVRLTIHDGTSGGTIDYQERQTATTNAFGLFTCLIGTGTALSGTFATINWGGSAKYLQVEFDPAGGTSYIDMGTTQLITVPYAKVADVALNTAWGVNTYGTYALDSNGYVGIGTSTPTNLLTLYSANSYAAIQFTSSTTGQTAGSGFYVGTNTGAGDAAVWNFENQPIFFGTNSTERMRITEAGNVGIGTDSPDGQLTVINNGSGLSAPSIHSSNANAAGIGIYITNNSTDATAVFTNATGNAGNPAIMAKFFDGGGADLVRIDNYGGLHSGRIILFGDNSSGSNGGYIYGFDNGVALGDIVSGVYSSLVVAYTPTVNAPTFVPEGNNTVSLGDAYFRWSAVYSANGTIQTSDERLKENIKPITYGLNTLMSLNPVSYQWKDKNVRIGEGTNLGFLAQDIEKVLPEVVVHSQMSQEEHDNIKKDRGIDVKNTDTYGVKYSEMIPVLVKAIQEQQAEIEALKLQVSKSQK
jgi:hypothetical protein